MKRVIIGITASIILIMYISYAFGMMHYDYYNVHRNYPNQISILKYNVMRNNFYMNDLYSNHMNNHLIYMKSNFPYTMRNNLNHQNYGYRNWMMQ